MPRKTKQEMASDALEQAPDQFLGALKEGLTTCRSMVWSILQNKQFVGFTDAQNLVKAYDHINKTLQIFSKFQLPLPLKNEEARDAQDNSQAVLPRL